MKAELLSVAYQHLNFANENYDLLNSYLDRELFGKGDFLQRKGRKVEFIYFIEAGLVQERNFTNGKLRTIAFYQQNDWAHNPFLLAADRSSSTYIKCITDCIVWKISKKHHDNLRKEMPSYNQWIELWMTSTKKINKKIASLKKIENTRIRYLRFKNQNPYICQHAPLYALATFLEIPKIELREIIRNDTLKNKKNRLVK